MEQLAALAGWIWQYGIVFLLVLTLVVFIHELGHFLVARWCGVAVKAFSIGFGPEIFGFNDKHGTRTVAAPVFSGDHCVATIAIIGTVACIPDSRTSPIARKLLSAARRLSADFGDAAPR